MLIADGGFLVVNGGFLVVNGGFLVVYGGFLVVYGGFLVVNGGFLVVNGGFLVVNGGFLVVNGGFLVVNGGFLVVNGGFLVVYGGFLVVYGGFLVVYGGFLVVDGEQVIESVGKVYEQADGAGVCRGVRHHPARHQRQVETVPLQRGGGLPGGQRWKQRGCPYTEAVSYPYHCVHCSLSSHWEKLLDLVQHEYCYRTRSLFKFENYDAFQSLHLT